jgi:sulfur-oxidizing protein SoxZ
MKKIKIRAKSRNGICDVRVLIKHPMETGLRKDKKTGKKIPAHFIDVLKMSHNDELVLTAYWSGAISKNPFFQEALKDVQPGDTITVTWHDNQGNSGTGSETVR